MSYYQFKRQEILQKAKYRYFNEKAVEKKQESHKRKVKESIQKLVKRRKRQN